MNWVLAPLRAGSAEDFVDGTSESLMSVRYHQFHSAEALADSERRKASQKAPSSLVPTSIPMISRLPSPLTAVATTTLTLTILPSLPDLLGQCVQPQVGVGSTAQRTAHETVESQEVV